MAKVSLKKGTTSYLARVFIQDSSSVTGAGLTGLTSGTSGLVCYRARDDDGNAAGTAISLSGGTRGTWSSGGLVEKDATHMAGVYELGVPNAALAAGSNSVLIYLGGAANMAPCVLEIELTGTDNQDAVRGGMTALPNAAANAAGGLPISAAGGLDLDEMNVDIEAIQAGVAANTPQTGDAYAQLNTLIAHAFTYDSNNLPKVDMEAVNGHLTVGGKDWYHALWYVTATTAGLLPSGAGTGTEAWQDFSGVQAVSFAVDSNGNRTAATYA